jgi:glucosamine--fructose-6-phosphate aminotransferase (isomerizing)
MFGIVRYIGEKPIYDVLINGLKKLEYRGYDSSGIMIYNKSSLVKKSKGKAKNSNSKDYTYNGVNWVWMTH